MPKNDWDENIATLQFLGIVPDDQNEPIAQRPGRNPVLEELSVEQIVARLEAIKERLDKLQQVFSTTLSKEVSREIDAWRSRFKTLADELLQRDGGAEILYPMVVGREDFYLALAKPPKKPVIPLSTQRWSELTWEIRQQPQPPRKPVDRFGDGLSQFLT